MVTVHSPSIRVLVGLLVVIALPAAAAGAGDQAAAAAVPADAHIKQLVEGNTAFALDLFASLRGEEGNLFISPHSVSTALAMTFSGARAETARQMASTLHLDLPDALLHPTFGRIEESLLAANAGGSGPELYLANRLWGQRGMAFRDPFLVTARLNYAGGFEAVDFAGATEQARRTINTWIEAQTKDRIEELLLPSDLDPATVMVLTNAVYFKSTWLYQFDERYTRNGAFALNADQSVTVPFMGLRENFAYFQSDQVQAVELPYDGERLSMVLLVPAAQWAS